MITKEDKLVYILTNPELEDWTDDVWNEMWNEYIEACSETAEDNDQTLEETMEWFLFLDWLEEHLEDQEYIWETVMTSRD